MNPTNTDPVYDRDKNQPVTPPDLRKLEQGGQSSTGSGSMSLGGGAGATGGSNFSFNPSGDKSEQDDAGTADKAADDQGFRFSGGNSGNSGEAGGSTGTTGAASSLMSKELAGAAGVTGAATSLAGTAKNFFLGSRRRKQASAIGGGLTATIVGGFIAFTFVSGPFEFIHIAQLMEQMHFLPLQDESNDRLFKEMRYVHYKNKGEAYKTNLGYIGNKLADKFDADLKAQGLTSTYTDVFGLKDGYAIDRDNQQFKGMTDEEIEAHLNDKYSGDGKLQFSTITDAEGNEHLFMKQPSGFFLSRRITTVTLQDADLGRTTSAIGARIMGTRDGVTWHPLKKLDTKIYKSLESKYAEWQKERAQNEGDGIPDNLSTQDDPKDQPGETDADKARTAADAADTSANGAEVGSQGDEVSKKAQSGAPDSESSLSAFTDSTSGKVLGGTAVAAGVAGVLCMARGIVEKTPDIKQAQVALPLVHVGMRAVSEGNQIPSGQDIDVDQISQDSKQLYDATTKTDWSAAQSIQAGTGHPNSGVAPDSTLKTIGSGTPFDFLVSGSPLASLLNPVCSTAGQVAQNVIGFLGGPVSFIGGAVVSSVIAPPVMDKIAHYLAGQAIDYLGAKGAQFGSYVDYGTRLAANDQAISAGGRALSTPEEGTLAEATNGEAESQFAQHNIAYRLFNPNDRMSLVSSVMDNQTNSVTNNMSNVALAASTATRSLASTFSSIFSGIAHATPQPWDYGFPEMAFSEDEMNNASSSNPYANGDVVANLLDNNGKNGEPDYISLADKCFGDTLQQISVPDPSGSGNDQVWDVQFGTDPVNIYTADYKSIESSCNSTTDQNWLKIRFFIFDTQNMKAADCYNGDDQMCTEMGFDTATASSGTTTTATTAPTTTASATIDLSTLYDSSVNVACAPGTKDLGLQDGYYQGNEVPVRTCAISNMPSTASEASNGLTVANSRVSAALYAMAAAAKSDGVNPVTSSGFRSMALQECLAAHGCGWSGGAVAPPGTSNHQLGLAIDVEDPTFYSWMRSNSEKFGYKWYGPGDSVHFSPTGN